MTDSATSNQWLAGQKRLAEAPLHQLKWLAPLTGLLIVCQAWLLAYIVDAAAFRDAGLSDLLPWMLALLPVFGLRFLAGWRSARLGFQASRIIKTDLRARLFDKLRRVGPVALSGDSSGALAAGLIDAVEALDGYFSRYVPAMVMMSMVPLIVLLVVFPGDWVSGLVLLFTAPLIPVFMTFIGRAAERRNQAQWRQLARMGAYFLNVIQTLPTLKMFNASRGELDNIARISDEFRRTTMSVLRLAFLTSAVLEFFAAISIALIAVFVGFRLLDNQMNFFYGLFVLLLAPEFYLPLRNFGVQNHARMEAAAAAEQLVEILQRPEPEAVPAAAGPISTFHGDLQIRDLHFTYAAGRRALDGLELEIPEGRHIAIVGPSGSGKSTLASLLLGFIRPDRGEILVGGSELTPANTAAWRSQISWIPQRARLFHGSIADNIRLGAPDVSLNRVLDACETAHAMEFIEQLPQGIDTLVGEGGQGLSGGQIQRIAIARALVRDTRWLLLDEPSAHLDPESERLVTEALTRIAQGRTLISIAHRLQTVRAADRIAVLSHGRIVQQGGFGQLAAETGPFRDLLDEGGELS